MSSRCRCCALAVALCAIGAPAPAVASSDVGVASLLAKHRAFVGWELGDGAFKTLRLTRAYVDERGKTTQRTTELRVGIVYRNKSVYPDRGATVEETGFTGNVFWSSNQNGFTTPLYGELAKFRLSYAVLANEGTASLDAAAAGTATIDGKVFDVVRLDVPHADKIDVYVDPASGAYAKAVIDPGGDDEATVQILSYVQVLPGKRMIGAFRLGDGSIGTYSYTKIEPNVAVGDADLHPPSPRAAWTFANAKPFPVTVTPRRILVDAFVNGVKGRFILDTGASSIFLNESFADRANLEKLNVTGTAVGLYGAQRADTRRADSIQIGGNTLRNLIVVAQDFNSADYRGLDRQNYDGLLGYDVFAAAVIKLDFASSTMALSDPAVEQGDPAGLGILTDTSGWIPTIPMTLNRSLAVDAMLDTGNPSTVVFGPDLLYKYHLRMARNIGVRAGFGSVECGNLETLQIGSITYYGEAACKIDSPLVSGRKILLGLDFLRHFTVVFDYPRGRLFLQPTRQ
jgi:hypothetical protein